MSDHWRVVQRIAMERWRIPGVLLLRVEEQEDGRFMPNAHFWFPTAWKDSMDGIEQSRLGFGGMPLVSDDDRRRDEGFDTMEAAQEFAETQFEGKALKLAKDMLYSALSDGKARYKAGRLQVRYRGFWDDAPELGWCDPVTGEIVERDEDSDEATDERPL